MQRSVRNDQGAEVIDLSLPRFYGCDRATPEYAGANKDPETGRKVTLLDNGKGTVPSNGGSASTQLNSSQLRSGL
ncbi:hypothetical protein AVEN_152666-1 [Araneus ventricosus]|uniref:Uncharacterized protein n=1 Tax=Araneus ventricosus TaxID=182803 RepID=A0A4Y2DCR5_ARAVE|nr:hypothetical protein AVEN_152666-1 [Araneus ventricosus]